MDESKPFFKSRTVLTNALFAVLSLYPPLGRWISANPETAIQFMAVVNLLLRYVTKGGISLFPQDQDR